MKERSPESARKDDALGPERSFCEMCDQWHQTEDTAGGPHFLTKREVEVLDRMRQVKAEAHEIKRKLGEALQPGKQEREVLSQRLALLQERWKELDQERVASANERMRLLGHNPD